jgi:hypothetical protein
MTEFIQADLIVKKSPVHDLGVFAKKPIKKNQYIEVCPMILVNGRSGVLADYVFGVDDENTKGAFACGYGSIYNHSSDANAKYYFDEANRRAFFIAERYIAAGEEIFIDYGDGWFGCRQLRVYERPKWRRVLHKWLHPGRSFLMRAFIACSVVVLIKELCVYCAG